MRFVGLLLLGSVLVSAGPTWPTRRMFPTFVLIRVPGSSTQVLLYHEHVAPGGGSLEHDSLALLYMTLKKADSSISPRTKGQPYLEVAEFFGPSYRTMVGTDNKPLHAVTFAEANHYSRIYILSNPRQLAWDSPVVAPGGAEPDFYVISPVGAHFLETSGLPVR